MDVRSGVMIDVRELGGFEPADKVAGYKLAGEVGAGISGAVLSF